MKISENGIIALISSAVLLFSGIVYLAASDKPTDNRIIITPNDSGSTQRAFDNQYENETDSTKSGKSTASTTTVKTTRVKTSQTTETSYIFPADINKADKGMLCAVSGIGDKLADNILNYKSRYGDFKSMYELINVDGIGEGKLGILMKHFYVVNDIGSQPPQSVRNTDAKTVQTTSTISTTNFTTTSYSSAKTTAATEPRPVTSVRRKVNINTANADEIRDALLIDDELAAQIVEIREMIGSYTNIREVLMADGFSQELLVELDEYIEI